MKLIGAILIRLVIYAWLSMWVLLRVHAYPPVLGYILPGTLSVIILMSVLFSFYPYDKNLLKIIVNNKKHTIALFIVLALIWIQILYEWLSSIPNYEGSSESYMYYGHMLIVMGLPSSIIVVAITLLLEPIDLIPGIIYNTWEDKTLTWFSLFIPALAQFYLLYRWLGKKWIDTANPTRKTES